jgi:hypothetical protein
MSDREMRRLLQDVMDDIEAGRVKPRRRFGRLKAVLGGGAIAATLALTGCDTDAAPVYGVPPDATVQYDAASDAEPLTDAEAEADAEADAGPVVDYGGPDIDAGVDAGPVVDYGGPDIDAGAQPEYGSP